MKGFKNSTRIRSGFSFPSSAGFTSSTGKTQNIAYTRKTPHRKPMMKAEGGTVKKTPPVPRRETPSGGILDNLRKTFTPPSKIPERQKTIDKQLEDAGAKRGGIMRKATGGVVDSALHGPTISSALDQEAGPKSSLRPGFTRGGYAAKYANGGKVKTYAKALGQTRKSLQSGMGLMSSALQAKAMEGKFGRTAPEVSADLGVTTHKPHYAKGGRIPDHKMARKGSKSC